jgi:hypothetical protein
MTFGQVRLLLSGISFAFFGTMFFPGAFSVSSFTWGEPPASVLVSKCERLWVDEARNDPALECYLTSQKDRLCRDSEKKHLRWFISRYEGGKDAFQGKLWRYLLSVQTGMAWSKPAKKNEDTLQQYNRVVREQAGKLKTDELFVKALKMRTLTDEQLTALLRKLAENGYVSADDFGWRSPTWVTDAFTDVKVNPRCKPPQA